MSKPALRVLILLSLLLAAVPSVDASQITPNPNSGTIDIINDPSAFNSANPFTNTGIINIDATSTLTNNAGAALNINSPGILTNNGTLINNGDVGVGGFGSGTLINTGTLINNGSMGGFGSTTNAAGATLNNSGSLLLAAGAFFGAGTLTNAGTLNNLAGGTLNALGTLTTTGTLNNFAGATFTTGEFTTTLTAGGGTLNNYGSLSTNASNFSQPIENNGKLNNVGSWQVNSGVITNTVGATLNNSGAMTLASAASLQNAGTLINTGSIGGSTAQTAARIANSGTVLNNGVIQASSYIQTAGLTVNNGTLTVLPLLGASSTVNIQGGSLRGTGIINAPVIIGSAATLAPGTPTAIGALTITGDLQSSGNLAFRISPVVGQFDVLRINGNAAFTGGIMSFSFLNSAPHIGDSWDFLYASAISGWNTLSFVFSGLGAGEAVQFQFHNGIETMRIVAVPEPSSILLSGLGVGGMALWRRLRRT